MLYPERGNAISLGSAAPGSRAFFKIKSAGNSGLGKGFNSNKKQSPGISGVLILVSQQI